MSYVMEAFMTLLLNRWIASNKNLWQGNGTWLGSVEKGS